MQEIWKPIPDYEQFYEVSNFGNVRTKGDRVGNRIARELKQKKCRDGYLYFRLNNGVTGQKIVSAHRTVAKVFVPNPQNKPQVNHKDFNRTNNHVSNLEWVTAKENTAHAAIAGKHNGGGRRSTRFNIVGYEKGMTATKEGRKKYMHQYRKIKRIEELV